MGAPTDRLDSWKEIAAYLGRSVRTVRRWEADEGLPVHRHRHRALGSVYAFRSEIDAWRSGARATPPARPAPAAAAGTPDDAGRAIAVLPFANLGAGPDDEYLADGLTDEIIGALAGLRRLRVTSRTSAMTFRGANKNLKTIASELGVRFIVEGSVRRAGARLRIAARLVEATRDETLWSEPFDGALEEIFAIQERIARRVAQALLQQLTGEEERRLARRPIENLPAYECYLQARQEALRWRPDSIANAVRLLRNGLAIVGENAELYAALGRTFLYYREAGIDFGAAPLDEAERCARRVLALDPGSAAAMQLRGWIRYSRGRIQEAVDDLHAARRMEPGNPDTLALLANCLLISGRVAEARPLIARLVAIDPLTPLTSCMPGWADLLEGDLAAALAPYRRMLELDPGNPMARLFYTWVLALNGRTTDTAAVVGESPSHLRDTIPLRIAAFLHDASRGDASAALARLGGGVEAATTAGDVFPRFLADGCALAGLPEQALDWLSIAVDRGFINHPFLSRHNPLLAPLRGHSRFEALMADVQARYEAFRG